MECSKKQTSIEYDLDSFRSLKIKKPDETIKNKIARRWDDIAKPLDGLGVFEEVLSRIGAIGGSDEINLSKRALIIMCADNGIVKEGVSQSGFEVTLSVAKNILNGKSSVAVMAEKNNIDMMVVDVGINSDEELKGALNYKINKGTKDFLLSDAMSEEETLEAVNVGINLVKECKKNGYDIILTGEMGIGNTTTSTAVAASILAGEKTLFCDKKGYAHKEIKNIDLFVEKITGRGAGLDDEKLANKKRVILEAIRKKSLLNADVFKILSAVGGFDTAALSGVCIGGAIYGIPIVLDGAITLTAALVAEGLCPGVKDYLFASHRGKEPVSGIIAQSLSLKPAIDANMALGEGTGAVMMMSLLDDALCIYKNAARFSEISVENYKRNS